MKVTYYPGCTLKTKARNLEDAAVASMKALGVDMDELTRWNCCGAVHSLADDDLIHHVAPVRDLVRAKDQGSDAVVTLCSMCYNSLARANLIMKDDEVKRKTINDFMNEENDYSGEVEVLHFLNFLRDQVGWDKIRQNVKTSLSGMKVAMYYGCTLVRPTNVAIEPIGDTKIMGEFLEALGAVPVDFPMATTCCGAYQIMSNPEAAMDVSASILESAMAQGAEAVIVSCPLCEYNLAKTQKHLTESKKLSKEIPVYYFTQLLALALGLGSEACRLDLNDPNCTDFLKAKCLVA